MITVLITDMVTTYEKLWIFSDEFGSKSFEKYFQNRSSNCFEGYAKTHFDVVGFSNNSFSENPSLISRLGNLMKTAISM